MSQITAFIGPYAFLSNFYVSPVRLDGAIYPTVEHAYQAAKTLDPARREQIRLAATPGDAKRLGRRMPDLRADWATVKIDVMLDLLRQKFPWDSGMARALNDTGTAELIEGNTWGRYLLGSLLRTRGQLARATSYGRA